MASNFNDKDGPPSNIKDWDTFASWTKSQAQAWDWLVNSGADSRIGANTRQNWNNLLNEISVERNRGVQFLPFAENMWNVHRGALISTGSDIALQVETIRKALGDSVAAYAYAFLQRTFDASWLTHIDGFRAASAISTPDSTVIATTLDAMRAEQDSYRQVVENVQSDIRRAREDVEAEREAARALARRQTIRTLRRAWNEKSKVFRVWTAQIEYISELASKSVKSINDTEAAYSTQMALQAPVKYWKGKARVHRRSRAMALRNTRIYFISLLIVMAVSFIGAGCLIHSLYPPNVREPVALYILISGSLAALSTVGFWIGRIVTKLYLSEHHLATDADERKVLTETFLALQKGGDVSNEERQIILAALFRNTSDGIVKEDGPTDVAIQSLLAKLVSGGKA